MLAACRRPAWARFVPLARRAQFASTVADDYFALLGCERRFDLDPEALHHTYKQLVVEAHPDKLAGQPEEERLAAQRHASELTHAFSVLKNPAARAKHMLELYGAPLTEETGPGAVDGLFLMRVMEMREAIEDAKSRAQLEQMRAENSMEMASIGNDLARAFVDNDLDNARRLVAALQYVQRIDKEIEERLHNGHGLSE